MATATRPHLQDARLSPPAAKAIATRHAALLQSVVDAVEKHDVVVVGMAQNPHVRRVRNALSEAGVAFEYLEFGSYFSRWPERLTIKLWSGWPTFPQVFVQGNLLGGADLTKAALADGSLKRQLES